MSLPSYLPFHRPDLGEEEIAAVVACLRSGWLTTGPECQAFEAEFAAVVGCRYAVAVNSCTAALHLALEALGVGPGDAVLVPTLTFTATAEVVHHVGARPVLVDIDPLTLNIDAEDAECRLRECEERVRAIIPVHFGGLPCDMDAVQSLARRYGLRVVEDAAHALPASLRGRSVGTLGDAAAFSFYATKNITTGEGGMLTTDDESVADRARCMSLHGISRDAWKRYSATGSWSYDVVAAGFKYNLTDMAAALGRVQLRRCDEMRDRRARIAEEYSRRFVELGCFRLPSTGGSGVRHAWHLYPLRLRRECWTIDRAEFIERLKAEGIGTSVHFIPLHLHPHYRDTLGARAEDFPVAGSVYPELVSLPLFSAMTDGEVDRVCTAVESLAKHHTRKLERSRPTGAWKCWAEG